MSWFRRRRRSARVVLLDPSGRVLLFRQHASDALPDSPYWYLPGGGILPFEKVEAAARRELREETGIRAVALGPVIGERADVSFVFRGRRVVQDEWYVAACVPTPHVGTGRHGDGERRAVEAHRWWSIEELAATGETVFPPELRDLVRRTAAWAAEAGAATA
jgi:8-oxo-dGTP pyrophosphatase MutT (NUDIX family)